MVLWVKRTLLACLLQYLVPISFMSHSMSTSVSTFLLASTMSVFLALSLQSVATFFVLTLTFRVLVGDHFTQALHSEQWLVLLLLLQSSCSLVQLHTALAGSAAAHHYVRPLLINDDLVTGVTLLKQTVWYFPSYIELTLLLKIPKVQIKLS